MGYHNRSYTDHEHLIHFQGKNGVHLGCILHGRTTCTEMVNCISDNMRNLICQLLIKNGRKIALIADESTSVSSTSRLIIYIRAVIHETPENMFLDLCELDGQDALSMRKVRLASLEKNGFTSENLSKHLVAFTSDGASVMLGVKSGVGTALKEIIHL